MNYPVFTLHNYPNNFYIYVYLDPNKPGNYIFQDYKFSYEPFYIGKGNKNRAYHHYRQVLRHGYENDSNPKRQKRIWDIISEGTIPIILILQSDIIDEKTAYQLESKIIYIIGMESKIRGPLLNRGFIRGGKKGVSPKTYFTRDGLGRSRPSPFKGIKKNLTIEERERISLLAMGENSGRAILTEEQVKEIRQIIKEMPDVTNNELSKIYNVSPRNIYSIKNYLSWKHI